MNILFINYEYPPNGGGAANATYELALAMTKLGCRVTVVTSRTPTFKGVVVEEQVKVYRLAGLRRRKDRSNLLEMLVFLCAALIRAVSIARENNIHATICFFSIPSGPVGLILRKLRGIPYLVSLRGGDVPGLVPSLVHHHNILKKLRRKILSNSISIVANSLDLAQKSKMADPFDVEVIPNGVDIDTFRPALTENCPDANKPLRLVFVGRFHKQKNVPRLIENLALIHNQKKLSFHLTLVGDGPDRIQIQKAITKGGLNHIVDSKGWLKKTEIVEIYQDSDCFLNLSHYEGFPNTVLEAMSCGLVVVASKIAPHQELIENGVTGYLVSLDNPEELSQTLCDIAHNSCNRQEIGRRSRQKVQTSYVWKSVAMKYLELLSE